MFKLGDYVKIKLNRLIDAESGVQLNKDEIYEVENVLGNSLKLKENHVVWHGCDFKFKLADKPTEDKSTCVHMMKSDISDSVHCAIYDHAIMKGDCLGNCEMQKEDTTDIFEPTKSYFMEHKDEYAYMCKNGEIYNDKMTDYDEDLTHNEYGEYDVKAIYKLMKVWERDERPEMTIAEIEEKYNVRVKRGEREQ